MHKTVDEKEKMDLYMLYMGQKMIDQRPKNSLEGITAERRQNLQDDLLRICCKNFGKSDMDDEPAANSNEKNNKSKDAQVI